MKIYFIGVFEPGSTNISQANCLEKIGNEVIRMDYRELLKQVYNNNKRDQIILNEIIRSNPDLILIAKGTGINPSIMNEIPKNTIVVLWYPDSNNDNFNQDFINRLKICDIAVFGLRKSLYRGMLHNKNCIFLHEGYDPDIDKPYICDPDEKEYDVTFIGNPDKDRRLYLKDVKVFMDVYGEDHAKVVSQSIINLNLTRNEDGTSDRVYKILAAGGFCLTQPWEGIGDDYKIGEHLDVFTTIEEMQNKIEYYLTDGFEKVKQIRQKGYEYNKKYSRINWARRIIQETDKLRKAT